MFMCILAFVGTLAMVVSGLLLSSHPYLNAIVSIVVVPAALLRVLRRLLLLGVSPSRVPFAVVAVLSASPPRVPLSPSPRGL